MLLRAAAAHNGKQKPGRFSSSTAAHSRLTNWTLAAVSLGRVSAPGEGTCREGKGRQPPGPPLLHPGEEKVPSSPTPHTLRATPFSLCYYGQAKESDDCTRDLPIKSKPRPGSSSSSVMTVIN